MKKNMLILPLFLVAVVALILGVSISAVQADDLEFEECEFNIEFNFTDEDLGVRAFVDGEPWTELTITDPDDVVIVDVLSGGGMVDQGFAEWNYESGEPTLAEVPINVFLARFPEGTYLCDGTLVDGGDAIVGEAEFTHDIPCGFDIDADVDPPGPGATVTITWDTPDKVVNPNNTVAGDVRCRGPAPEIEGFEVIIEGDSEGVDDIEYSFKLPGDVNELVLPLTLFPDGDYKYEVIAIEESGNQTIKEAEFEVPEPE